MSAHTLVRVYNRMLVDMLLECKARSGPGSAELKRVLRANEHKAIDPSTADHIAHAAASLGSSGARGALVRDGLFSSVLSDAHVKAFEPLRGVSFALLLSTEEKEKEKDAEAEAYASGDDVTEDELSMCSYLYTLATLALTHAECQGGASGPNEVLAGNVLKALARMQGGGEPAQAEGAPEAGDGLGGVELEENPDEASALDDELLDSILEEDIVVLLRRVGAVTAEVAGHRMTSLLHEAANSAASAAASAAAGAAKDGSSPLDEDSMEGLMNAMKNSKIADLAHEISKELDFSALQGQDPEKLLNFANLGAPDSVLGSIVGKVGSKIQNKLASGELRQEDLLADAMSMLKAFDGNSKLASNPLVGSMLKAARTGHLGLSTGKVRSANARERLRTKLAERAASSAMAADQ